MGKDFQHRDAPPRGAGTLNIGVRPTTNYDSSHTMMPNRPAVFVTGELVISNHTGKVMLLKPTLLLGIKAEPPMPLHPRPSVNPGSGITTNDDVAFFGRVIEIAPHSHQRGRLAFEVAMPEIAQRFAGDLNPYFSGDLRVNFLDLYSERERTSTGWGPYLRRLR